MVKYVVNGGSKCQNYGHRVIERKRGPFGMKKDSRDGCMRQWNNKGRGESKGNQLSKGEKGERGREKWRKRQKNIGGRDNKWRRDWLQQL